MDRNSDDYNNISKYIFEDGKNPVDMVNHPPHYQSSSGLEVIDVI